MQEKTTKHTHTPGPWEVDRVYIREKETKIAIGRVFDSEWNSSRFINLPQDANASLIAAAPDLLAALEDVVKNHGHRDSVTRARAAIAKAKGEA